MQVGHIKTNDISHLILDYYHYYAYDYYYYFELHDYNSQESRILHSPCILVDILDSYFI